MTISAQDRDRLAKLLAMFSSDFDGEVVSAARAAHRIIMKNGETWESVISAPVSFQRWSAPDFKTPPKRPQPAYRAPDHFDEVKACQERANLLTAWELEFLISLLGRDSLSEKQRTRLDLIKAKLAQYKDMDF